MTCITASFALSCGRHDVVDADMMAAIELCYPVRQSALGYRRWLNRNADGTSDGVFGMFPVMHPKRCRCLQLLLLSPKYQSED